MKIQKKLKRGLADLSNFFASSGPTALPPDLRSEGIEDKIRDKPVVMGQENRSNLLAIEPPEFLYSEPSLKPSFITGSVLSFSPSFQVSNLIEFTEAVQFYFSGIHFVSLASQENSFEYAIQGQSISYEKISWSQLEPLIQPQMRAHCLPPESATDKTLVIFDSGLYSSIDSDSTFHRSLFELLDHCVFAVEPDTKQLMQVYQVIKTALSKNPSLHFSLLLAGNGAERFSEFIYERFSEMISRFLDCNLGFLGWMENHEICINPDLLKEEANSAFVRYCKTHLSDLLDRPQLVTS